MSILICPLLVAPRGYYPARVFSCPMSVESKNCHGLGREYVTGDGKAV